MKIKESTVYSCTVSSLKIPVLCQNILYGSHHINASTLHVHRGSRQKVSRTWKRTQKALHHNAMLMYTSDRICWVTKQLKGETFITACFCHAPRGWWSEYVNPYISTQTPEEDWSDHMQSPGWQPTLWLDVWSGDLICKFRKSMVLHDTECPYWDQVSLNNTNQTCFCHIFKWIQFFKKINSRQSA